MPDRSYSVSDIQDYFEYIIKKHKIVADNPLIQIYISKHKNRVVFNIKTGYKLDLLSGETMRLLGSKEQVVAKKRWKCA